MMLEPPGDERAMLSAVASEQPRRASQSFPALLVLALGFGLVGFDRFLISTMFPVIARELHLSYGDVGAITGALAVAWGLAALVMGNGSDRIGRRRVLVGALIVFSLSIGASGLAQGLAGLIAVRLIMGLADGAYTPASISATIEAASPAHVGRYVGLQAMMLPLCGLGLAPLLVGQLLQVVDWRFVFPLFSIPGLILAFAVWRIIPSVPSSPIGRRAEARNLWRDLREVVKYSNVRLSMVLMLCWLTCLVTTSALLPSYLLDHLHLSFDDMSHVMSAVGLGAAAGCLVLPWVSDWIGRKPVMVLGACGVIAALLFLSHAGADITSLFVGLFAVHFFNNALMSLTVGTWCSETVPPALMATASGLVVAVGEFFGGGVAPFLAGHIAERFGISSVLWLPIGAIAGGLMLCPFLKETRRGDLFAR